jgi:2-methylcitrate dehydratase PrpD
LDKERLLHAFGIAGSSAPIPFLGRWERAVPRNRAMTKYAFYGPIAENGTLAAMLAREGFIGDRDILDGDVGFWRLTGARGVNAQFLANDLGAKWWISDAAFKAYPGCRHVSAAMDLLADIVRTNRLTMDDIEAIEVRVNPVLLERHFGIFPSNEVDMLFSASYLLAVGMHYQFVASTDWLDPRHLSNEAIRTLASKVQLLPHGSAAATIKQQLDAGGLYRRVPTEICVRAKDHEFTARAEYAKGDPWSATSRMTDAELADKFRCFSEASLGAAKTTAAIERILRIDELDRIDDLITCLQP